MCTATKQLKTWQRLRWQRLPKSASRALPARQFPAGLDAALADGRCRFGGEGATASDTDLTLCKLSPSWGACCAELEKPGVPDAEAYVSEAVGGHVAPRRAAAAPAWTPPPAARASGRILLRGGHGARRGSKRRSMSRQCRFTKPVFDTPRC